MKRVTGLGGFFFKAKDPKALYEWYRVHLGIDSMPGAGAAWDNANPGGNVWAIFPDTTTYLGSPDRTFMMNFRVDDLHALVKTLRAEGVQVDDKVDDSEYGKFGWITDPEGNRVELWEPPKEN